MMVWEQARRIATANKENLLENIVEGELVCTRRIPDRKSIRPDGVEGIHRD